MRFGSSAVTHFQSCLVTGTRWFGNRLSHRSSRVKHFGHRNVSSEFFQLIPPSHCSQRIAELCKSLSNLCSKVTSPFKLLWLQSTGAIFGCKSTPVITRFFDQGIMRRRYCVPGVCLHGGRCLNGKCRCSRRYTGSHCQLRVYQPSASGQLHLHTSSRSQRAYPAGEFLWES